MKVELHLIQNFAPACLNRDDTNAPKDCEFGGYRRARISSQCIKRAIRQHFRANLLLPEEHLARRTKLAVEEITKRVIAKGQDKEQARPVVEAAIKGAGLDLTDSGATEYLLFLGEGELEAFADTVIEHWDALLDVAHTPSDQKDDTSSKARKKKSKAALPSEVKKALAGILDGGKAADLALFGRMLADLPDKNIDAACQVAHAISTHAVTMEMDFYTAVDDLQPKEETGAGMMGVVEFNSACFYRYALIDVDQLVANLGGDADLARKTVEAFLRAAVAAIPTGKQNSFAAQNPPSCVLAVVRDGGMPWSLANAFVRPVTVPSRPTEQAGLVGASIERLDDQWGRLASAYGATGIVTKLLLVTEDAELTSLADGKVQSLEELVQKVMEALA